MPLSVNVGLSKKASRDYQSTGVSINVTAELDQSLLAKPAELQAQIDALYAQAETAIARQVNAYAGDTAPVRPPARGNGYHPHGAPPARAHPDVPHMTPMTASQRRAIAAIARRANLDPDQESQVLHGVGVENLTIRQASDLIDHLKDQAPGTPERDVRR